MLEIHNSFNVFVQTLNVNQVCQVRVNSGNLGFTQTWENNTMPNKTEMWLHCFEQIWRLNGMKISWYSAYLLLLFLFRANGKKGRLDEHNFRHCYGFFFLKRLSESYVITATFKVPSQQIQGTLTTAFWKIPCSSLFYGHRSACVLNLSSRLR